MTLYVCVASGVFASGRDWTIRQKFSSAALLATVEADWLAQAVAAWTDGTHGLQTLYPTTTVFTGTTTYQMALTLGPPIKEVAAALAQDSFSHAGTSANDGLPDQDAVLVSLRTAGTGPNNRGRTYLPAIDETVVAGDIIGNTQATRVTAAMTALRAGMAAAGHTQVIWNHEPTRRDPVIQTTKVITSCKTDRVIRTQLRRVRKELHQYV